MKKLFLMAAVVALTACTSMTREQIGDNTGSGDSWKSGASSMLGKQNEAGGIITNVN